VQRERDFLSIIEKWWKQVNVHGKFVGQRKRDPLREPVTPENIVEKNSFLQGFSDWLVIWADSSKACLSKETRECATISGEGLAVLSENLILEQKFNFFLAGKCTSDPLEGKFGKYRNCNGTNLYASIRQFLEADRSEKVKKLSKLNLTLSQIKDLFLSAKEENNLQEELLSEEIATYFFDNSDQLVPNVCDGDANALFYVSGYLSRYISNNQNCSSCRYLLIDATKQSGKEASESEFLSTFNRGGLTSPSETAYLFCCHAWAFYQAILSKDQTRQLLINQNVPSQRVFVKSFLRYLSNSENTQMLFFSKSVKMDTIFQNFSEKLLKGYLMFFQKT